MYVPYGTPLLTSATDMTGSLYNQLALFLGSQPSMKMNQFWELELESLSCLFQSL
jgi:hypothetical protein